MCYNYKCYQRNNRFEILGADSGFDRVCLTYEGKSSCRRKIHQPFLNGNQTQLVAA